MGIIDISGQRLLFGVVAMLVLVATHGFFVALFSRLLGDKGPAHDGRLTLNPLAHAEVVGAIVLILTSYGWIKPVTLTRSALRGGVFGAIAVIVLSVAATLLLGWALWALRPVIYALLPGNIVGITLIGLAEYTARASVSFAVLNLLPIPPLTAGLVWAVATPALYAKVIRFVQVIAIALGIAVVFGAADRLLGPVIASIRSTLFT